ncbi:MAG: class I SAM-dependent methyltransferase [Promethearchaeota archaeon]
MSDSIAVTLESTMVGPLWARAMYSRLYPELLIDEQSVQLIEQVRAMHPESEAEFAAMEAFIDEFYGLNFLIRARIFDDAIRAFLSSHPDATIVNIGCGLDTTFSRVDNGRLLWYDLDLPDAIAYRQKLVPQTDRNRYLGTSAFTPSWLKEILVSPEKGVFCFAGGFFHYFPESEVATLLDTMATQLPEGELLFDMPSRFGLRLLKRRFRSFGIEGVELHFGLGNAWKEIPRWSSRLQVIDWFPMFSQISKNPKWKFKTRMLMRFSDWLKVVSFVHIQFKS